LTVDPLARKSVLWTDSRIVPGPVISDY